MPCRPRGRPKGIGEPASDGSHVRFVTVAVVVPPQARKGGRSNRQRERKAGHAPASRSPGLGGPGSMIGFDLARTFNPPNRLGTATGIVNVGGFVASLVTILLVGVVLDLRTGGGTAYGLADFRAAMAVQALPWAVGTVGILRTR